MKEDEMYEILQKKALKVEVPESLEPSEIEKQCRQVNQKKSHKKWYGMGAVAAAVLLCVLVYAGSGLFAGNKSQVAKEKTASLEEKVAQDQKEKESSGGTYAEIYDCIRQREDKEETKLSSAGSTDDTTRDHSTTDLQVQGVDEGELVQTDGSYIYILKQGGTVVIHKVEGEKTRKVASLSLKKNLETDGKDQMYLCGNKLLVLTSAWTRGTVIYTVDITNPTKPVVTGKVQQSGSLSTSRMKDGYLYTFSVYYPETGKMKEKKKSTYIPKTGDQYMDAGDIYYQKGQEASEYLVVTTLSADNPSSYVDQKALLAKGDTFYVSGRYIYAVDNGYVVDGCVAVPERKETKESKPVLYRFGYDKGRLSYKGQMKLSGIVESSYQMQEMGENLAYIYTKYGKNKTTNGICLLGPDLKKRSELGKLGEDENLMTSYFVDKMAYFVTYRTTDPVFVIDCSNPDRLEKKQELKLPGYSGYLHSFGEKNLIGLGYTGGDKVKLTAFDKDEKGLLKEADTTVWEKKSSTDEYDHHSVWVDADRKMAGFTVYEGTKNYYGVYRLENGRWKREKKVYLGTDEWYNGDVRGVRIGLRLYIVQTETGKITSCNL